LIEIDRLIGITFGDWLIGKKLATSAFIYLLCMDLINYLWFILNYENDQYVIVGTEDLV